MPQFGGKHCQEVAVNSLNQLRPMCLNSANQAIEMGNTVKTPQ